MPIMSIFILVLNLYPILVLCMSTLACSATESQIIVLYLILSFVSIRCGLLVHNLFQNCTIFMNFIQFKNSTVCNNVL